MRVVECGGQGSGVDVAPAVAGCLLASMLSEGQGAILILEGGDAILKAAARSSSTAFLQQGAAVEDVSKRIGRPPRWSVADLSHENRYVRAFVSTLFCEECVPDLVDQNESFDWLLRHRCICTLPAGLFAGRSRAGDCCLSMSKIPSETQITACFCTSRIASTRSTSGSRIDRRLNDTSCQVVHTAAKGDHPAIPAHDLNDGNAPMAFGGRADAAARSDVTYTAAVGSLASQC